MPAMPEGRRSKPLVKLRQQGLPHLTRITSDATALALQLTGSPLTGCASSQCDCGALFQQRQSQMTSKYTFMASR